MEKLEKKKHDHKATKILKFLIFMFVMFAPFFSILSKCLYTLNPNSKESYYGQTINESQNITTSIEDMKQGFVYYIKLEPINTEETLTNVTLTIDGVKNLSNETNYSEINRIRFFKGDNTRIFTQIWTEGQSNTITFSSNITFEFKYIANTQPPGTIKQYLSFYYIEYNNYSFLDNVFEYAVDQLNNDNLYNWSKNTGVYTAIQGMITELGANEVLSMLLAYWSILTAIYIVFDIVIECFVKLTHMFSE